MGRSVVFLASYWTAWPQPVVINADDDDDDEGEVEANFLPIHYCCSSTPRRRFTVDHEEICVHALMLLVAILASLRPYQPSDPTRDVEWSHQRPGQQSVELFEEREVGGSHVTLDSRGSDHDTKPVRGCWTLIGRLLIIANALHEPNAASASVPSSNHHEPRRAQRRQAEDMAPYLDSQFTELLRYTVNDYYRRQYAMFIRRNEYAAI